MHYDYDYDNDKKQDTKSVLYTVWTVNDVLVDPYPFLFFWLAYVYPLESIQKIYFAMRDPVEGKPCWYDYT